MTIKNAIFPILLFNFLANATPAADTNSIPAIPFIIDQKDLLKNFPAGAKESPVAKNDPTKGRYFYNILTNEQIKTAIDQNESLPCMYCPNFNMVIVGTENPYDCDALRIAILASSIDVLKKQQDDIRTILNKK